MLLKSHFLLFMPFISPVFSVKSFDEHGSQAVEHSVSSTMKANEGTSKRISKKKPKGYGGKEQTTQRIARRLYKQGKVTTENALEEAQKQYRKESKYYKIKAIERQKASGVKPKSYWKTGQASKEHRIKTGVLKLIGRETNLEEIKKARFVIDQKIKAQRRVSCARWREKKT